MCSGPGTTRRGSRCHPGQRTRRAGTASFLVPLFSGQVLYYSHGSFGGAGVVESPGTVGIGPGWLAGGCSPFGVQVGTPGDVPPAPAQSACPGVPDQSWWAGAPPPVQSEAAGAGD